MDDIAEELIGWDYVNIPLKVVAKHPDFSAKALRTVSDILGMTTAQLEHLIKEGTE